MHNSKKAWVRVIIFILLFIIINNFLIFIICPKGNYSRSTILEMYSETENIDVVFSGSSYSIKGINPYIMDEQLENNTFCYGFSAQIYIGTYYSLKELFKYHKPKTVILNTDLESYTREKEDIMAYIPNFLYMKPSFDKFKFYLDSSEQGGSYINKLFLWPEYHVKSLKEIPNNIKAKLDPNYINYPQEEQLEDYKNKKYGYIGKGFVNVDPNDPKNVLNDNKLGKMEIKSTDLSKIKESNVEYFKKIVDLCKENDSELILVHFPLPTYRIFNENNYFKFDEEIYSIAKENGIEYYNYNLTKPELFKSKTEYFQDYAHLNANGAEVFSKSFAEFLKLRSSGENMSKYFYTPEEYFDTINYINNTWFTWKMDKDKIDIKADSFYGNNIKPEYQFILIDSKTGKKEVIRDYDTNPNFTLKKPKLSTYKIRVNAREVGNNVEFSRYYEEEFGKK
ncbi:MULTISPECIES: hypothetical protein [Clostridium]|uniref:hypothetical protein n=2 Tax=Clostridium TaxID=1485 RepID=UPI0007734FBB|nr:MULTISPECIES: hypothetical protein [Clostridium]MBY6837716.1 hypothetical protein [Clostridium botulinum]NFG64057.1 hypothetical protein [Clostridium botulinum]NFH79255.1 hypothetical protein [Clostridium botulinum]NFH83749.1 hypothetical protein [Clostridium botulinum]NFI10370.1 hypothetical protein [Clostridium botulinum]